MQEQKDHRVTRNGIELTSWVSILFCLWFSEKTPIFIVTQIVLVLGMINPARAALLAYEGFNDPAGSSLTNAPALGGWIDRPPQPKIFSRSAEVTRLKLF